MRLLDFPFEFVWSIIQTTVQDAELRPSATLREMCSMCKCSRASPPPKTDNLNTETFDSEVMRSYEISRIFASHEDTM